MWMARKDVSFAYDERRTAGIKIFSLQGATVTSFGSSGCNLVATMLLHWAFTG